MPAPDGPRTVLDLFDAACARHGDGVALDVPPAAGRRRVTWTYRRLSAEAQRFRAAIAPHAARDAVVVLALPRTDPRLFAAMLGAMRAGCAYCAIDPSFPDRQAAAVVRDARACAIVGPDGRVRAIADAGGTAPWIDPDAASDVDGDDAGHADPRSLAYVIYTSGTTGAPKGVEVEHRSLLNLVAGDIEAFGLGPGDRVAQGSSASYDSSVEELWLAWAVGATAVVMDDEIARLGPDLAGWLRRERITVLCPPPTLLRTLGLEHPADALPDLRLVYVGGEALPEDVAARWSTGMRLENGYGPTECTVTCLRCTVHPGEPVTIGQPIPGTHAWVVDADRADLPEVSPGVHGELVIGGASLARGYRGQPDVTAARFVDHPALGRVYRTGDRVHRDAAGAFHYHGRIDAQVKLRGHRVELGAVEARLAAQPGVLEAACTVQGIGAGQRLEAHVVMRPGVVLDASSLRAALAAELPPALVPTAIAAIDAIPRSVGGKIDRRRLPTIADTRRASAQERTPMTETERRVADAIGSVLGMDGGVDPDADFFDDLGLDSLTVAMVVSRLRTDPRTRAADVRMTYEHRTVRAAAAAIDGRAGAGAVHRVPTHRAPAGRPRPTAFMLMQAVVLAMFAIAGSQVLWMPQIGRAAFQGGSVPMMEVLVLLAAATVAVPAWTLATVAVAAAAKWTIIGRYRPMRVRAWSWWHLRHWTVVRVVSLVPWGLLEATGLAPAALRLLGARVGRGVHVHAGVRLTEGGWDLITLEDGATIGQDASLRAVDLDAGCLVVAPITVRRHATVETRAGMSGGAELGEGSVLRPLSNLVAGTVHANAVLDGVPAVRVGEAPCLPSPVDAGPWPGRALVAVALATASVALSALPWALAVAWIGDRWRSPGVVVIAVAAAAASTVVLQGVLVRVLGRPPQERISLHGAAALRMAAQSALVESAGRWLSGTLMWPWWLRLAGARIGRGCEISTVTDVLPHAVSIGRETFFADGIYLGGPTLRAGSAQVDRIELGQSCFVGNHAVLPGGTRLADGTLVGISTSAEHVAHEPGSSWFGHPPFRLPRREVVEAPRELTHDPSAIRRANRWSWELARFALPALPVLAGVAWFEALLDLEPRLSPAAFRLVALPGVTVAAAAALVVACIAMKWALVGRVRPGTHPLWSCWCSRWDFLYVAWGMWAAVPLTFLEGTAFLPAVLRLFGCRIGRRALLGAGFAHVVDPDMLRFGDDVTVQALMQAHTFEDRVLKIDHVHVHDGATVGANAVLLYGADVGAGATVAPHSVVMKRERLEPGTAYEGVPTRRADG